MEPRLEFNLRKHRAQAPAAPEGDAVAAGEQPPTATLVAGTTAEPPAPDFPPAFAEAPQPDHGEAPAAGEATAAGAAAVAFPPAGAPMENLSSRTASQDEAEEGSSSADLSFLGRVRARVIAERSRPWVGYVLVGVAMLITLSLTLTLLNGPTTRTVRQTPRATATRREPPPLSIAPSRKGAITDEQVDRLLSREVQPVAPPQSDPKIAAPVAAKVASLVEPSPNPARMEAQRRYPHAANRDPGRSQAQPSKVRASRLYKPGTTIKVTDAQAVTEARLHLPLGTKVPVRLQEGVSSTYRTPVLVRVLRDVAHEGSVVLKAGDLLKGRFANDSERIYVMFFAAISGGVAHKMAGHAQQGGYPGVIAQKRAATFAEKSKAGAVSGAIDATKSALSEVGGAIAGGTLPGRVVGSIAGNVANGTLGEVQHEVQSDPTVVLMLQAGKTFDAVITED